MAAVIPGFTPENIRAFIEQSGLTVDLDQFNDLVANAHKLFRTNSMKNFLMQHRRKSSMNSRV